MGTQALFGYEDYEIVGKSASVLAPPDARELIGQSFAKVLNGAVSHHDSVGITKDGCRVDISVTVSPIKNSTDDIKIE